VRVALDEGVRTTEEAMSAALNHECTDITLKPAKFGYPACVRLLNECHEQGIDAWVGGMFDTGVARWANVRLAMHQGATLASDIGSSSRYWTSDITTPVETSEGKALISHLAEVGLSGTPLL
jgi:O-succinylbenzoate synthase